MATDAKIDELIDSLERLVKTLSKSTGSGSSATAGSGTARRTLDLDDSDEEAQKRRLQSNIADIDNETKALERRRAAGRELSKEEERRLQQLEAEKGAIQNIIDAYARGTEAVEEQKIAYEDLTEAQHKSNQEFDAGKLAGEQVFTMLGIQLTPAFEKLSKVIVKPGDGIEGMVSSMKDMITSGAVGVAILSKLVAGFYNAALEVADAGAAFVGATGAATSMTDSIADTRNELRAFGVDGVAAGKAAGVLFGSFSDFSNLNKSMKSDLMGQAALLDNIGVSMGTTAGIFDQATKSLGYTSSELVGLTQDIQNVAQSVGKTSEEVFSDFGKVAESLAFYGKDAIKVFTELEKQSKATGLSVDKLVSISGKAFDTFDGAAQKIGRLNAILGGPYLNSIDMLNASEAERIEMLKQSMDMSGQVFSDLNKFEQLAIADALGVGVEDARRMFGNLSAAQQMNIREQEKIAETAKKSMKQMEKLTAAVQSLFVAFKPLVNIIVSVTNALSSFLSGPLGKGIVLIGGAIVALISLALGLRKVGKAAGTMKKSFDMLKSPIKTLKEGFKSGAGGGGIAEGLDKTNKSAGDFDKNMKGSFIDTFKELMEAVKGSYKEILAFGAAILAIGGGIYLAATGLAELVKAFTDLTGPQALGAVAGLLIVMGGFAIMLAILAKASLASAGPLIAVGIAFLAIGGGIYLAAYGLAILVESFASLGENANVLLAAVGALTIVMVGFVLMVKFMVPAIAALAAASALAAPAIAALGFAFLAIGAGVAAAALVLSVLVKSFGSLIGSLEAITGEKLAALRTLGTEALKLGAAVPGVLALAASLAVLALASVISAKPIILLGASFAIAGLGIGLFAAGVSKMSESFASLIGSLEAITGEKLDMLKNFGIEAFKLGAAAPGVLALAASFGILGLAMSPLKSIKGLFTGGFSALTDRKEKEPPTAPGPAGISTQNVEQVNDAIVTSTGRVLKTHPEDMIVAMKPGGDILSGLPEAIGNIVSPLVAIGKMFSDSDKEKNKDVQLNQETKQNSPNITVVVKIGEKEIKNMVVDTFLNDREVAAIASSFGGK